VTQDLIGRLIKDDMRAVDTIIRQRLDSDVVLVRQVAEYIIGGGGKRLRPALLLASAGACGFRGAERHQLAAIIEFIHTATLLHDDVVDESAMRRGRATANAMFGNAASVLVGDFLYSRAFQMMVDLGSVRVMEVLADATNVIAEGEVLQLLNVHNPDTTEEGYLRVIRSKTAKLFEAAGQLGAILAGAETPVETALREYGAQLGIAFQLIDDVLDYSGELAQTGKNLGDDLAEGKPTLPLIYAMRTGTSTQVSTVRGAITSGGREEFSAVLQVISDTGALEYTREQARRASDLARARAETLPSTPYQESLLELAAFAVARNY
jgi:octaprenyl-diphosphate synthase